VGSSVSIPVGSTSKIDDSERHAVGIRNELVFEAPVLDHGRRGAVDGEERDTAVHGERLAGVRNCDEPRAAMVRVGHANRERRGQRYENDESGTFHTTETKYEARNISVCRETSRRGVLSDMLIDEDRVPVRIDDYEGRRSGRALVRSGLDLDAPLLELSLKLLVVYRT